MTAIVAGQGLGLFNTSLGLLGANGQLGDPALGKAGESVYVNAENGNLVVQRQDEWLVGLGPDISALRTYNSQGQLSDDNGDNWRLGLSRSITSLTGTVSTAGSTVQRVGEDGLVDTYAWDGTRSAYVSKSGSGAFDTLTFVRGVWTWIDGSTQTKEVYSGTGTTAAPAVLTAVRAIDGNQLTLTYTAGLLTKVQSSDGETLTIGYDTAAGKTSNILYLQTTYTDPLTGVAGTTMKRVSYAYDSANRLHTVTVDLTPTDNSTADNVTYVTTYDYVDTSSRQLLRISTGTASVPGANGVLEFAYYTSADGASLAGRIKSVTDVRSSTDRRTTNFSYGTGTTTITDALNQVRQLTYDTTTGLLTNITVKSGVNGAGGVLQSTSFHYDVNGNVDSTTDARGNQTVYQYDGNGNRTYERDAQGNVIQRYYDSANLLRYEVTYTDRDPDGSGPLTPSQTLITRYVYDGVNHLRFVITPQGRVTEYQYDATKGVRTAAIQYTGNVYPVSNWSATYAPLESDLTTWLASTTAPVDKTKAQRTDYTYDLRGDLSTQTSYTSLNADGSGNKSDGQYSTIQYIYDPAGNLLKSIDSRGDELATRDTPWAQSMRTQLLGAAKATAASLSPTDQAALRDDFTTIYTYDGLNRILTRRDGLLAQASGQPVLTQASVQPVLTQTAYTDSTSTVMSTAANGLSTTSVYDLGGRLLSVAKAAGATSYGTTTYTYDNIGQLRRVQDPTGVTTYALYDEAGRKVGQIDGNGALTEFVYNGDNQLIKTIAYSNSVYSTPAGVTAMAGDPTALTLGAVRPTLDSSNDRYTFNLYDTAGHLAKSIDAAGAVTEYTYDGAGRLIKTTAYATLLTPTQFSALTTAPGEISPTNPNATVNQSVVADRNTYEYYDSDGRLVGSIDAQNFYTENTYDSAGRLIKTVRYANSVVDDVTRVTPTASDYLTKPVVMGMDPAGGPVVVSDSANDQATYYLYDTKGQLVGAVDPESYLTEYIYDTAGNKTAQIRYATRVSYSSAGTPLSAIAIAASAEDQATLYQYDADNRVIQTLSGTVSGTLSGSTAAPTNPPVMGALSLKTTYTYDAMGNLLQSTQQAINNSNTAINLQRTVMRKYDALGRVTAELDGQNSWQLARNIQLLGYDQNAQDAFWVSNGTGYSYDNAGRMVAMAKPNTQGTGDKTIYYYDGDGRMTYSINALGEVTQYGYNSFGDQTSQKRYGARLSTSALNSLSGGLSTNNIALSNALATIPSNAPNSVTSTLYDKRDLATTLTDELGNISSRSYTAFGQLYTRTDKIDSARSLTTYYVYDIRGNLWYSQQSDGGVTRYPVSQTTDAFGRVIQRIDADSNIAQYAYDRLGREVRTIDGAGVYTYTTYDAFARVFTTQDGLGQTTTYTYDTVNGKFTIKTPEGIQTTTQRNEFGDTVKVTDGRGNITQYIYDKDGHRTGTTVIDGVTGATLTSSSTKYDVAGRVIQISDARAATTLTYDPAGRVLTRTVDDGPNLTNLKLKTTYIYDAKGQVLWVQDPKGTWTQTEYDLKGQVTAVTVDPKSIPDATGTVPSTPNNTAGLALRTEYVYDAKGETLTVAQGVDTTQAANTAAHFKGAQVTRYDYDLFGRRVQETVDPSSITLADGSTLSRTIAGNNVPLNLVTSYTYDKADNVITKMDALGNSTRYVYDADNRVTYTVDALGAVTQTIYDADGRISQVKKYANPLAKDSAVRIWNRPNTNNNITALLGTFALNTVVTASVKFKNSNPNSSGSSRRLYVGSGAGNETTGYLSQASAKDADGWQTVTVSLTVSNASANVYVYLYGEDGTSDAGSSVLFDNLSVTKTISGVTTAVRAADGFNSISFAHNGGQSGAYDYWDWNGHASEADIVPYATPATLTDAQIKAVVDDANRDEVTTYVYDKDGRQTYVIRANNDSSDPTLTKYYVTQNTFDAVGNVVKTTRYATGLTALPSSTTAGTGGALVSFIAPTVTTDSLNDQTDQTVYDAANRPIWSIDAEGDVTQRTFDGNGNVTKVTRYASKLQFVTAGQTQINVNTAPLAVTTAPTTAGASYVITSADDRTTQTVYDKANRVLAILDADGYLTSMAYDANGLLQYVFQNNNKPTGNIALNIAQGKPVKSYYAGDANIPTDGSAYVLLSASANDAYTTYTRDAAGRLIRQDEQQLGTAPTLTTTSTAYDAAGRVTDVTQGQVATGATVDGTQASITHYQYDGAGRVIAQIQGYGSADASTTRYVLDAAGNRVRIIDPRGIEAAETDTAWAQDVRKNFLVNLTAIDPQRVQGLASYTNADGSAKSYTQLDATQISALKEFYTTTQIFDGKSQLIKSIDPRGCATLTQFDAFGNANKVTDPNGKSGYFYFDKLNQTTIHVDPMGYVTQSVYNAFGAASSVVHYVSTAQNLGKAAFSVLASGTSLTNTYVVQNPDANTGDQTTTITHDRLNRQIKVTDALNNSEQTTYTAFGDKLTYTNKRGGLYDYLYDHRGNLITEKLPQTQNAQGVNQTRVFNTYEYDARGNRTKSIEASNIAADSRTTIYAYDGLDRLIQKTGEAMDVYTTSGGKVSGAIPTETRKYDARGNLIEVSDNSGARTLYYYDALNRKTAQLVGNSVSAGTTYGALTTYEYDDGGDLRRQRAYGDLVALPATAGGAAPTSGSTNVRETDFSYDANHRLVSTKIPNILIGEVNSATGNYELRTQDLVSTRKYDNNGNLTVETDARGNSIYHYYNALGQQIAQIDAEGYVTSWTYDGNGKVLTESKASAPWTLGIPGAGSSTVAAMLIPSVTNGDLGSFRQTTYTYDKLGRRLTQTIKNLQSATVDSNGVPTETTQDATTSYLYDGLGNVTQETESTGEVLNWVYDNLGREIRKQGAAFTDYLGNSVRQTTDTEYNGLSEKSRSIEQDGNLAIVDATADRITSYTYGKNGLLFSQTDAVANANIAKSQYTPGKGAVTTYTYDLAGHITSTSLTRLDADGLNPSTDITTYAYDLAGRQVSQATYNLSGANAFLQNGTSYTALSTIGASYDPFSDVVSRTSNGYQTQYATFDNAGQVVADEGSDGVPKVYVRDANGNITLTLTSNANSGIFTALNSPLLPGVKIVDSNSVKAALSYGAHASVAVFNARNLQTSTYELTASQVVTNPIGITESTGSTQTSDMSEAVSLAYTIQRTINATFTKEDPLSSIYAVMTAATVNYQVHIDLGKSSLPGDQYLVTFVAGTTRPIDGTGDVEGGTWKQTVSSMSATNSLDFNLSTSSTSDFLSRTGTPEDTQYTIWVEKIVNPGNQSSNVLLGKVNASLTWGGSGYSATPTSTSTQTISRADTLTASLPTFSDTTPVTSGTISTGGSVPISYTITRTTQYYFSGGSNDKKITRADYNVHVTLGKSSLPGSTYLVKFVLSDGMVPVHGTGHMIGGAISATVSSTGDSNVVDLNLPSFPTGDFWIDYGGVNNTGYSLSVEKMIDADSSHNIVVGGTSGSMGAPNMNFPRVVKDPTKPYSFLNSMPDPNYYLGNGLYKTAGEQVGASIGLGSAANKILVTAQPPDTTNIYFMYRAKGSNNAWKATTVAYSAGKAEFTAANLDLSEFSSTGNLSPQLEFQSFALNSSNQVVSSQTGALNLSWPAHFFYDFTQNKLKVLNLPSNVAKISIYQWREATNGTYTSRSTTFNVTPGSTLSLNWADFGLSATPYFSDVAYSTSFGLDYTADQFEIGFQDAAGNPLYAPPLSVWEGMAMTNRTDAGLQVVWSVPQYKSAYSTSLLSNLQQSSIGAFGSAFALNTSINYIAPKPDSTSLPAQSAVLRYRAVGSSTWVTPTALAPATVAGASSPGWFQFDTSALGLTSGAKYEYTLALKDAANGAGNALRTVYGTFTVGDANSISRPILASDRATTVHFSNVPLNATRATITYRLLGDTADRSAEATPLGNGNFDWDMSDVLLGSSQSLVSYTLTALDASNAQVAKLTGRQFVPQSAGASSFGAIIKSLSVDTNAYTRITSPTLTVAPSVALGTVARTMRLYCRPMGSTQSYSMLTVTGVPNSSGYVDAFSADLSSIYAGTSDSYVDVYYDFLDSTSNVISGYSLPTAAQPVLARIVPQSTYSATASGASMAILGATDPLTTSRRQQSYDAYGDVVQEIDPMAYDRIRAQQTKLGRTLTNAEIDTYATSLKYNNMGQLVDKIDPQTKATMESGYQLTQRADTHYVYDKQGRLVRTIDANGNNTDDQLLQAGAGQRLVAKEMRLDGGYTLNQYDVFGDLRRVTIENDALDAVTDYTYDSGHHVLRTDKPLGANGVRATDLYGYDSAGNRVQHKTSPDAAADASGNFTGTTTRVYTDKTYYDALGRLVKTLSPESLTKTMTYDAASGSVTTVDENGKTTQDWIDGNSGRVWRHIDESGRNFLYVYNTAGLLIWQYRAAAGAGSPGLSAPLAGEQNIHYSYYVDGTLKSIDDYTLNTSTLYEYDKNGNKTYEGYSSLDTRTAYQRSSITYDELNRISTITDANYSLSYEYDKAGNRRHVLAIKPGAGATTQDYWYTYDKLNRMVVSMGVLNGGRATSDDGSNHITQGTSGKGVLLGYDKASNRTTALYADGGAQEKYEYTPDGYLTRVSNPSTAAQISLRQNDLLGRGVQYTQNNASGTVVQNYTYDNDGKVLTSNSSGGGVTSSTTNSYLDLVTGVKTGLLQTSHTDSTPDGGSLTSSNYKYVYEYFDTAQQSQIRVGSTSPAVDPSWGTWAQGISNFKYDINGHLTEMVDAADTTNPSRRTIDLLTDAQGLVLSRVETGLTDKPLNQNYYYVNDQLVGESGNDPSQSSVNYSQALQAPKAGGTHDRYKHISPITSNFDENYQPINATYPSFISGSYTVRQGDTLEGIARAVWGDATLWYLIASANDTSDAALDAGQVLVIPNKVTNLHNNSQTARVYNPGEAMGDVSPTVPDAPLPPPPPPTDDDCGGIGQLLMVIVAVVATIYTAGAAASALGVTGAAGTSTFALGTQVLTGAAGLTAAGGSVAAAIGVGAASLAGAAIGGAIGSIASQAVGLATGTIDKFSWSGVALGAIGGAVGAELPGAASFGGGALGTGLRAAAGSVIAQGIGVATNLQQKFSWTSVAAAGLGAAAAYEVSNVIGGMQYQDKWAGIQDGLQHGAVESNLGNAIFRNTVSGIAGGVVSAAAQGLKPNWGAIAADSFRNSLGNAVVDSIRAEDQQVAQDRAAAQYNHDVVDRAVAAGENLAPTTANSRRLGLFNIGSDGRLASNDRSALSYLQNVGVGQSDALQVAPRMAAFLDFAGGEIASAYNWGGLPNVTVLNGVLKGAVDSNTLLPIPGGSKIGLSGTTDPEINAAYQAVLALPGHNAADAADVATMVAIRKYAVDPLAAALASGAVSDPTGRLAEIQKAMVYGLLAKDVYYPQSIVPLMPNGYSRVSDENLPAGITPKMLNNPDTGYFGALYQNANNRTFVFANRGTQDLEDVRNNVLQAYGLVAPQYTEAMGIATILAKQYGNNLSFVGHSLGGGLAAAQAVVTGLQAVTFNAAGLNANTVWNYSHSTLGNAANLITAYNVQGEPLNYFQDMRQMPQGWNRGGQALTQAFAVGAPMPSDSLGWISVFGSSTRDLVVNSAFMKYLNAAINPLSTLLNPPSSMGQQYEANFMPQAVGTRVVVMPATSPTVGGDGGLTPTGNLSGSFDPTQHFMSNMFYSLYQRSVQLQH